MEQSYRINDLEVRMGLEQSPSGQNYTTIGASSSTGVGGGGGTRSSGSGLLGSMVQRDLGSVTSALR